MASPSTGAEVVVVGAGVVGLMTAIRLAAAGDHVTVIEAASKIGTGQSGRMSGVVHHPGRRYVKEVSRLFEAQAFYANEFPGAILSHDGWELGPVEQVKAQFDRYRMQAPSDVEVKYGMVDVDAVSALFPTLGGVAALVKPEPVIDPMVNLRQLTARCLGLGVDFHFGRAVEAIEMSNGQAKSVQLRGGEHVQADVIVLAAGTGLNRLLGKRGLGASFAETLRTRQMMTSMVKWDGVTDAAGKPIVLHGFGNQLVGVVPAANGWTRAGTPIEADNNLPILALGSDEWRSPPLNKAGARQSFDGLAQYFPEVRPLEHTAYVSERTDRPPDFSHKDPSPVSFVENHGGGVISVCPGKYTLAAHVSADLALQLGRTPAFELALPGRALEAGVVETARADAMVVRSAQEFALGVQLG